MARKTPATTAEKTRKTKENTTPLTINKSAARDLLQLVQRRYPGWKSFDNDKFRLTEINPKQTAILRAQELLDAGELADLLEQGREAGNGVADEIFTEFMRRVEAVVQNSNLLWRKVPSQGDAGILQHPQLDRPTFCLAIFDLLYGSGNSPARLERYFNYVRSHKLPNKWTFPTYLLFVCHPQTEVLIQPALMKWFLGFIGHEELWRPTPSSRTYAAIQGTLRSLKKEMRKYQPHDMVDLQSFLWTARLATRGAQIKIAKPPVEYSQEKTAESAQYSLEQCEADLGVNRDTLCDWLDAIDRKGQAIFYGPPGTGKTYAARALARYLSQSEYSHETQSSGFWDMVQFHPAYAYEDFVQGLRPRINSNNSETEFVMMPGRFVEFCRRAQSYKGLCVLVIDEINRADVAQVFGELLFLLEYRDREIPLAGGGTFFIPANVRIIGTMNTANRSIATLDPALRRRFAFIAMLPNYEILRRFHQDSQFNVDGLIQVLMGINNAIDDPNHQLGISFFLVSDLAPQLPNIWRFEIEPYLEETFFDRPQLIEQFQWDKVKTSILL